MIGVNPRYEDPPLLAFIIDVIGTVVLTLWVSGQVLVMVLLALAGFGVVA